MSMDGKRVYVSRIDGKDVSFYATIDDTDEDSLLYLLVYCSNGSYEHSPVYKENTESYGEYQCDYYEEALNSMRGKRVHVTRLDGFDVDFTATLVSDCGIYKLTDCSNDYFDNEYVVTEHSGNYGENKLDYYTEIKDTSNADQVKKDFGLLSENNDQYDDEQLPKSYSELLSDKENEGKTLGQLFDTEFGDIGFVSHEDKILSTISSKTLDFVETSPTKDSMVYNPSHYNAGKYEVIDMLEVMSEGYEDPKVAYLVATAGKYLFRAPFKNNLKQDLEKAVWYLNRALTHL